jgi:hypothetical protein
LLAASVIHAARSEEIYHFEARNKEKQTGETLEHIQTY